ncbi:hypothetical protein DL765_008045 [Monosporascus sp. GIB2]|nr:hypothetical protein DL765_008045 [Monosporascus sp. GIB2]
MLHYHELEPNLPSKELLEEIMPKEWYADVAKFEADHLAAVSKVIEDEGIDCDLVATRYTKAILIPDVYARMKEGIQLLKKNNFTALEDVFCAEGHEAEQVSRVKRAKGCITYTAAHLFPYKLVMGLLSRALETGASLQTHKPESEVSEEPDPKGYFTITTAARGKVRAKKVVCATNAYTAALLPEFEGRIVPVRGTCSHIVPAGEPSSPLSNSYNIPRALSSTTTSSQAQMAASSLGVQGPGTSVKGRAGTTASRTTS